jgi:hypothetical protein
MFLAWISELFDATGFPTRGHCGPWSESLKLIYIASHASIVVAYFLIPMGLFVLWKDRRQDVYNRWILGLFMACITSCAFTHICDIAGFWWPACRFFTVIDAITAVLSVATALVFPWVVHVLLRLPTLERFRQVSQDLQQASVQKDRAINDLNETITALRRQVDHLERMRQTGLWVAEQESALRELRSVLQSSLAKEGSR